MSYDVFDPKKEWEYISFPFDISNLQFETNFHKLDGAKCTIKIWRDENLKLKAIISGLIVNPRFIKPAKCEEGPGNFAALDTITGVDQDAKFSYTLTKCIISSFCIKGIYLEGLGYPFDGDLHFESFSKKPSQIPSNSTDSICHYDWYVCASVNLFYPGLTKRFFKNKYYKVRNKIDVEIESAERLTNALTRDFFIVDVPSIKCIVSKVPKEFKISWAECYGMEYRSAFGLDIANSIKKSLEFFLGFLFGTEFIKIGSTTLMGEEILCQEAFSPPGGDTQHFCQNGSRPPIQFNEEFEWGKVQHLVQKYFPAYLENDKHLDLEGILWRFFQAKTVPVGVNLPILSSAMEKLCKNYLKAHPEANLDYLEEATFITLIAPEIELIKSKLSNIENVEIIINKMKGSYRRSDNERLNLFFEIINLPISNLEKQALKARNSMAHGGSDAKTMDRAKKLILHTRVYETLFHRAFLRILGYDDYYIDYYLSGRKLKKITTPTGP